MAEIRNVAIIGAGLMGCGIAQVFASHPDHRVTTFDSYTPGPVVLERVRGNLAMLAGKGAISTAEIAALMGRITPMESIAKAVAQADLVMECIPEQMELKQNLFAELEGLCQPGAIFATNTSVMSITEIASKAESRHRIVGTHFWNPPYLIPLVEVVKSEYTDDTVVDATMAVLKKAGKHPVRVNRDVPGFLANRLQHALWREAISIVEHGIADAAPVAGAGSHGERRHGGHGPDPVHPPVHPPASREFAPALAPLGGAGAEGGAGLQDGAGVPDLDTAGRRSLPQAPGRVPHRCPVQAARRSTANPVLINSLVAYHRGIL